MTNTATLRDEYRATKTQISLSDLIGKADSERYLTIVILPNDTLETEETNLQSTNASSTPIDDLSERHPFRIEFLLWGEIVPGWIVNGIEVFLELDEDNTWIVFDEIFNEYGTGGNVKAAKRDYVKNLAAYYQLLSEWATDDNPETQALLEYLSDFIAPTNP